VNNNQPQPDQNGFSRRLVHALVPKSLRMLVYRFRHPELRLESKLSDISRGGIESFLDWLAQKQVFSGNVLEIGAGQLRENYKRFAPRATNYWRSDIRLWPDSTLELICDCTKTPFRDRSMDGIICCEVLEHVPESLTAMEEIGRILKPEGRLAVTVPFFYPLHGVDSQDRGDYWRFTPGNLKNLLRKDFELLHENRTHMFFSGDPFVVNIQTLWKRRSG